MNRDGGVPWPSSPKIELAALGFCIRDPEKIEKIDEFCFTDSHALAFRALEKAFQAGTDTKGSLAASEVFVSAGVEFARSMAEEADYEAEGNVWDSIVLPCLLDYRERRKIHRLADSIKATTMLCPEEGRGRFEALLDELAAVSKPDLKSDGIAGVALISERQTDYASRVDRVDGIQTGFIDLDRTLRGIGAGDMVIVGARPSVGKSAFVQQVAVSAATAGWSVLLASPEMSRAQVGDRLISQQVRIDSSVIRSGSLSNSDKASIEHYKESMPDIYIHDASDATTSDIAAIARSRHAKRPLNLLIVDHLGYLADPVERGENQAVRIGRMTKALKRIGRKLGCAVIVVCQLNRGTERSDIMDEPGLGALRDSGEIEQDADTVILLHKTRREERQVKVIIAKARNGPTGACCLTWIPEYTRFENAI